VTIRDYEPRDFESLFEIDRAAFVPDLAYSRAELRFYLQSPRSRTLVAEHEGEVVGFAIGSLERATSGHVVTLDVRPGHQRRGIGRRLLQALEEGLWKLGARAFILETPAEEGGARRFYEKQGYVAIRRERGYYNGRRDAWRMVKRPARRA
jgi:[ribosomal protein S18]-alanine N-acetyltransferase